MIKLIFLCAEKTFGKAKGFRGRGVRYTKDQKGSKERGGGRG